MDFDFSDDQIALRDAVQKWVEKGYGFERRRTTVEAGGFDRAAYLAPIASTYFNTRKTTIYGGSNEVQRNIVAQTVLGG